MAGSLRREVTDPRRAGYLPPPCLSDDARGAGCPQLKVSQQLEPVQVLLSHIQLFPRVEDRAGERRRAALGLGIITLCPTLDPCTELRWMTLRRDQGP